MINRKNFLKQACVSGVCLCGFGRLLANTGKINKHSLSRLDIDQDALIMQKWVLNLLKNLENEAPETIRTLIRQNGQIHYKLLNFEETLADYKGNIEKFAVFLEKNWGWMINLNKEERTLTANENKSICVCPIAKGHNTASALLCYCSEGFAEMMFSAVLEKKATAKVISSILRGDKNCIYQVKW